MMHEPIMSNDNQWLVFAGVVQLGFGRDGRHEIYVWRDGDQHPPVRLTFDTEKDSTPSLFVPSPN
jgi:hypothetical protein